MLCEWNKAVRVETAKKCVKLLTGRCRTADAGESRVWSRVRVRLGWVLEHDADAAARGVFDDLFGLAVEVVVPQAATGEVARG